MASLLQSQHGSKPNTEAQKQTIVCDCDTQFGGVPAFGDSWISRNPPPHTEIQPWLWTNSSIKRASCKCRNAHMQERPELRAAITSFSETGSTIGNQLVAFWNPSMAFWIKQPFPLVADRECNTAKLGTHAFTLCNVSKVMNNLPHLEYPEKNPV